MQFYIILNNYEEKEALDTHNIFDIFKKIV